MTSMSKKNVGINKTEKAVLGILISNPEDNGCLYGKTGVCS